jgi:3-oxoacyl-[acyl-carrier-protein] synthase III
MPERVTPEFASVTALNGGQPGVRTAAIESVAMAVPDTVVTNDQVAERAGVTDDWIVARTGVRERRHAAPGERLSSLAAAAGREALERAGVHPAGVDLVLVATLAADELTPNAAPLVAHELGCEFAGAYDVGSACTGFLSALHQAAAQVESGRAGRVLVIGAEIISRLLDPSDRGTAALFADGAGAALVGPSGEEGGRIGPITLGADGAGAEFITAGQEERLIRMRGHETFREAVRRLSGSTLEVAAMAGLRLDEIDLFVYHQANARILAAVADKLDLDRDRVIDCIDRYGNTSSATIPIALAEAVETGRLNSGDTALLAAFGAGFTWGAGVIEWR